MAKRTSLIIGRFGSFAMLSPGGRAAFEKEGRPVPSICFSIDALYAVVCGGGRTDTRHIGAGVYESIKTHPRQAPARRGPRG